MDNTKLFDTIKEGEPLTDLLEEVTQEQGSDYTTLTASSDEEHMPVPEQVAEKKQRRKRTKKSNDTDSAVGTDESVEDGSADTETTPDESDTKDSEEVPANKYKTGDSINIRLALLYSSSVAPKHFKGIKGRYYIWDGTVVNGRVRLTDSPSDVGRPERMIGWVKLKNIQ